jgi:superfamily I DNA/RNA helicase/DNA polymerase III epsilon subunit-like protein
VLFPPSLAQRAIIELAIDTPAIVVKAGPGSGKTRVLCDRIVHLLQHGVDPGQITAVTFTQLAAAELRKRIEQSAQLDVWTGTFHGYAYRILNAHGANWGYARPIRVLDETGQRYAIRNAFNDVTGYRCDEYMANEIAQIMSLRKRKGLAIEEYDYTDHVSINYADRLMAIDQAYHTFLADEQVLDYDELIYQVNRWLRNDDTAIQAVRAEARWLLLDEFQDVSDDQYALISIVAPVGLDDRYIFAVGDERQSIYRFRGASSKKLFARLKVEYLAREYGLNENFRSTRAIVLAANLLQPAETNHRLTSLLDELSRPIHVCSFRTETGEAGHIARTVAQRIAAGDPPESIAILYSTHRRANVVEHALSEAGVPLYRHVRNSIHARPEAEPLIALMRDVDVPIRRDQVLRTIGLSPAGLVDEFDWIRWDRERAEGRTLEPTLGLEHRLHTLADCMKRSKPPRSAHGVQGYAQRLLNAYGPILDVIDPSEWPRLLDHLEYIDRYVQDAVLTLQPALDAGLEIVLLAGDSRDAYLARALLQDVLPDGDRQRGQFYLCLGCDVPGGVRGIRIAPVLDPTVMVTITMQAWRLAQSILPTERFDGFGFVAVDIETTSTYADSTDIIELGAVRFDPETGEVLDRFESLIWNQKLSGKVMQLTGITATELHQAPKVTDVLQRFIAWLRPNDILVGHNVADFDLTVLDRHAITFGFGAIKQPSIDTMTLSKRLMPQHPFSLEDLMASLPLTRRPSHRALPDAETTAELFRHLMVERDRRMRVRSIDGALPLVAASLLEYPHWETGDGALLAELGARRLKVGASGRFVARARQALGLQWNSLGKQLVNRRRPVSRTEEDWYDFRNVWSELIERHHALMPGLTATELAASIALSANHNTGILPGHVTMMTVHAAKGKEWPTVLLIGAEDDQFPSRSTPSAEEIEEGGRLFYVGVTRARSRLLISWAEERNGKLRKRSRFLDLIPNDDAECAIHKRYQH